MPVLRRWERKSVSQLVQQYQSCTDLRDIGKYHKKEDLVDGRCHEGDVRVSLSRCLSMDVLPQRPASSTRALCALFESKLQYSNKPLDGGLQDRKNYSNNPNVQKDLNLFERTAMKECSNRGTRVLKGDKNSGILIKGSSIQSRYHILTSSSVRDRSALYLSSAADAPGEQPESSGVTHERKTKVTKFQFPVRELCSACLTPVYPMEKMVANKLILHSNCFCCKHCKKKLGLHNYSSLYGEFYCVSHYQQLFKRKGNYDEGFGHKQHKDRWIQKTTKEPDAISPPKATNTTAVHSKGGARPLNTIKFPAKNVSSPDDKGKLKISWHPENKSSVKKQVKYELLPKKESGDDFDKGAYDKTTKKRDDKQTDFLQIKPKILSGQDMKKSDSELQLRKAVQQINPVHQKETRQRNNYHLAGDQIKPKNMKPQPGKSTGVTKIINRSAELKPGKARKTVHFEPNIDTPEDGRELATTKEEKSVFISQQEAIVTTSNEAQAVESTNLVKTNIENDELLEENSNNLHNYKTVWMNIETTEAAVLPDLSQQDSRDMKESELKPSDKPGPMVDNKRQEEITVQEREVSIEQNVTNVDSNRLNIAVIETKAMDDVSTSDLAEERSSPDTETDKPLAHDSNEKSEVEIQKSANNEIKMDTCFKAKSTEVQIPGIEQNTNEQDEIKTTKASHIDEKSDKPKTEQENMQKKVVPRTTLKPKVGSWSKGMSPLSKLFTSSGNNKAVKADAADVKRSEVKQSGGILGKLFQAPVSQKNQSAESTEQNKTNETNECKESKDGAVEMQTDALITEKTTNAEQPKQNILQNISESIDNNEKDEDIQSDSDNMLPNSKSIMGKADEMQDQTSPSSNRDFSEGGPSNLAAGDLFGDEEPNPLHTINANAIIVSNDSETENVLIVDKVEEHFSIFDQTQNIFDDIVPNSTLDNTATAEAQSTQEHIWSLVNEPFMPDQSVAKNNDILNSLSTDDTDFNFDLFASNNDSLGQPSAVTEAQTKASALSDDIFGLSDFLSSNDHKEPANEVVASSLSFEGLDIFASDPEPFFSQSNDDVSQLFEASRPQTQNQEMDKTSGNWMDDLLG